MLVMMVMFKWRYDRCSGNCNLSNINERKKIQDFNRIKTHGFQFASSFCDDDDCEVESDGNDITCNIYNGDVDDV